MFEISVKSKNRRKSSVHMSNLSSHHGSSEISNGDESLRQAFIKSAVKNDYFLILKLTFQRKRVTQ